MSTAFEFELHLFYLFRYSSGIESKIFPVLFNIIELWELVVFWTDMSLKNSTIWDERCTVRIKNDEQCLDSNRGRSAWLKPWSNASTDWVNNSLTHSNTVGANQKEENSKIMTWTFFNMKLAKPHTLCKPTSSRLGLQPHSLQLFMGWVWQIRHIRPSGTSNFNILSPYFSNVTAPSRPVVSLTCSAYSPKVRSRTWI